MNCQTILHRVQLGRSWRQRRTVMLSGTAWAIKCNRPDRRSTAWAPGSTADGSHQGMTSPAPFPATDRAEGIGPFGALVAGRPRAPCHVWPRNTICAQLILLADAGFIMAATTALSRAFREPRPDLRQFGGEVFFKSLAAALRVVARPRRDLGEAERLQLAPDRGLVARWRLQEPPRQVLAPPAHDAVHRRDRAAQQPPPVRGGDRR